MPSISAPFTGQHTELHLTPSIGGTIGASTLVGEVEDLGSFEPSRNVVDLLSYSDDDVRRLVTAKDNGTISVTLNWAPDLQSHDDFNGIFIAGVSATFAIHWVSGAGSARADFTAYVSSYGVSHPKDDKVTCTVELTISGPVTYDLTPA